MPDDLRLVGGIDELDSVTSAMGMSYSVADDMCKPGDPNRNFLIGLIAKAASDYLRYRDSQTPKLRLLFKRAELWLFTTTLNGHGPLPGSFEWACEWLGENPQMCRARIQRMTIEDLPKVDHFSRRRTRPPK